MEDGKRCKVFCTYTGVIIAKVNVELTCKWVGSTEEAVAVMYRTLRYIVDCGWPRGTTPRLVLIR